MCIYLDEILSFPQTNFWLLVDLTTKVELKMVRLLVENFFFELSYVFSNERNSQGLNLNNVESKIPLFLFSSQP